MSYKAHILLFWGFIFLAFGTVSVCDASARVDKEDGAGVEPPKDTVQAFVMYGDCFLLQDMEDESESGIYELIDSLLCLDRVPEDFVKELQLYVNVQSMLHDEVISLIDSLFSADRIPYSLINQINSYVAAHPLPVRRKLWFEDDDSPYPANLLYKSWNTMNPNPYLNDISKDDTTLYLVLEGTDKLGLYVPPVEGKITSEFGWRDGRNHSGIDIDLHVWDTVVAAFPGMVRVATTWQGYGRVVVIRHYNGLETTYGHLHRIKVKPGQTLQAGELIGLGGSSGRSTGSHLHFECRFKGIPINPMRFISFEENALLNDTLILKKIQWGYVAYPKGAKFYTIRWGDNLYEIAKEYGTTIRKLKEMNGLGRRTVLRVGQKLRVV